MRSTSGGHGHGDHGFAAFPATASLTIGVDGRATLRLASQDIGTGTYTVVSQVVADGLGMPLPHVTTLLGDTATPLPVSRRRARC